MESTEERVFDQRHRNVSILVDPPRRSRLATADRLYGRWRLLGDTHLFSVAPSYSLLPQATRAADHRLAASLGSF